jgi:hypothetical protein
MNRSPNDEIRHSTFLRHSGFVIPVTSLSPPPELPEGHAGELRGGCEQPEQSADAADQGKRRQHGPEARENRFAEAAASCHPKL